MTYTIHAPGVWCSDIFPAMESWESDFDAAERDGRTDDLARWAGIREVVAQYWDDSRQVKRGRGTAIRFDLTIDGVKALRGEALYRFEFNGGNGNPYGCEEPDANARRASKALLDRCDAILKEAQA